MLKSILPKVLIRRHTKSQIRYSSTTSAFEKYDLCILGGGPGGFAAAMRAADYGQKVCVINKGRFGGAGLWDGALASKTMWEMAGKYIVYRRMALGLTATRKDSGDFSPIRWLKMNNMVDKILLEREDQMVRQLTASNVKIVDGYGQFTSPNEIKVESSHGDSQTILADKFLIATGSRPREHPTVKADGKYILTSDHISNMQRFPDSLVILGAGVIGCEYATIFSKFKQTKVFMIDRSERILPFEDADISRSCVANFRRRDVTIHEKCSLDSMQVVDGGVRYVVRDNVSGRKKTVHTQAALLSIGRVPNIDNIGLENTGVKLNDNGLIDAREFVGTSVPHIAVCGDANAQMSLVNVAENSARYAVHKFFAPKSKSRRPHFLNEKGNVCAENVSKIMFLDPEIAAVGINETDAQAAGIAYRCAVYSFSLVSRAMAMSETNGCIKLLVSNDKHMRILGIRVAGPHASSLIEVVSLMVRYRRSIKDLSELLTAYPAVTEGLMECVRLLLGSSMFKPSVFSDQARVFEWSPGDPLTTQGPCYD